jgi:hypothetical protein
LGTPLQRPANEIQIQGILNLSDNLLHLQEKSLVIPHIFLVIPKIMSQGKKTILIFFKKII